MSVQGMGWQGRFLNLFSEQLERSGIQVAQPYDKQDRTRRDRSIGVSAGRNKQAVTLASLRALYLNMLVADEQTALFR